MDEQKKKIIIIAGVVMVILVIILVVIFKSPKQKESVSENIVSENISEEVFENNVKNIVGEIYFMDNEKIKVNVDDGEKIILAIPTEGTNFVKEIEDGEEKVWERIGIFDVPQNQKVGIQYDYKTNELMMITVK